MLDISSHFEKGTGTWTYLLADSESKQAALIDPVLLFDPVSGLTDSSFIDAVLNQAKQRGYQLDWVIETHVHADHLSAARYVCQASGARLAAGQGVCAVQKAFVNAFNLDDVADDGSQFDRLLGEGDELRLGNLQIKVLETPGHTTDSISLWVEDAVFVGDTLFAPNRGTARCDFPGGNAGQLFDSIQKFYALPEQTRLFLCHDYPEDGESALDSVTVAESRQQNIHIKAETQRAEFIQLRESRDAKLSLPRLILASVQINIRGKQAPLMENNGVAYLKIPLDVSLKDLAKG